MNVRYGYDTVRTQHVIFLNLGYEHDKHMFVVICHFYTRRKFNVNKFMFMHLYIKKFV